MTMTKSTFPLAKSKWFKPVWISLAALAVLLVVVLVARWLRELPAVQSFMADYPGRSELPEAAPTGAGEATPRVVPAAIANAFFDATGVRIRRAPLTPERVKAALAKA